MIKSVWQALKRIGAYILRLKESVPLHPVQFNILAPKFSLSVFNGHFLLFNLCYQ